MEKDRSALRAEWCFDTHLRVWRPERVGKRYVAGQARRAERGCMQENIITAIPQGSADTVLEVALIYDDNQDVHIELRYLVWGAGVGWYRQHTLIKCQSYPGYNAAANPPTLTTTCLCVGRCVLLSQSSVPQTSSHERVHMGRKSTCCKRYERKGKACKDCPAIRNLSARQHCTLVACDRLEELLPHRLSREITRIHSPSSYALVSGQGAQDKT
jgi:hypothetical protein